MHPTSTSDDGIGRPSKNFDLPVLSLGSNATVALNLASLAMPQQMNVASAKMSSVERQPMVNARKAGATPKEIWKRKGGRGDEKTSIRVCRMPRPGVDRMYAYRICQTVQLLS